jgi:PilZ domain
MVIMTMDKPRTKTQREPRRQVDKQPAWFVVDEGTTRRECFVLDVAPGGAKIITDAAIDVGDRLELELVPAHPKRQPCEVVWRRGNVYGIKFLF